MNDPHKHPQMIFLVWIGRTLSCLLASVCIVAKRHLLLSFSFFLHDISSVTVNVPAGNSRRIMYKGERLVMLCRRSVAKFTMQCVFDFVATGQLPVALAEYRQPEDKGIVPAS